MVCVLVSVRGCVLRSTGHSLVTQFSLSVLAKDRPLHWILVRLQTYYPEHILAYGSRNSHCSLIVGSGSVQTIRKMDPWPIYFAFWCLMVNTTKLD